MGAQRERSFSLNKAQRPRRSAPHLHSTATLRQKPRAEQTIAGELSLSSAESITYLEILLVRPQKGDFTRCAPTSTDKIILRCCSLRLIFKFLLILTVNEKDISSLYTTNREDILKIA